MKILVLNCGSSTLKFQVIDTDGLPASRKRARGLVDRIGGLAAYSFNAEGGVAQEKTLSVANHEVAVNLVIDWLRSRPEFSAVDAIGHRVVHGGDRFASAVLIDDDV